MDLDFITKNGRTWHETAGYPLYAIPDRFSPWTSEQWPNRIEYNVCVFNWRRPVWMPFLQHLIRRMRTRVFPRIEEVSDGDDSHVAPNTRLNKFSRRWARFVIPLCARPFGSHSLGTFFFLSAWKKSKDRDRERERNNVPVNVRMIHGGFGVHGFLFFIISFYSVIALMHLLFPKIPVG